MSPITKLPFTFLIIPALHELEQAEDLWGEIDLRTQGESPHREVQDIWLRYNAKDKWENDLTQFDIPHISSWYPAAKRLPWTVQLCTQMMGKVKGERLGAVLLTRIPPGKQVYPHIDQSWHARFYEKFAIQLQGDKDQSFCFPGHELSALPGESYTFDNSKLHWVENNSSEPRITLIICIRRKPCHSPL